MSTKHDDLQQELVAWVADLTLQFRQAPREVDARLIGAASEIQLAHHRGHLTPETTQRVLAALKAVGSRCEFVA